MAIKPQDLDILTENDLREVSSWEERIDESLRSFGNGTCVSVIRVTRRVRLELIRRYEAAGWIVHLCCPQAEPAYLRFLVPEF